MKAIIIHQFGPPEVMQYTDFPDPQLAKEEILIKVQACGVNYGVNYTDTTRRMGKYELDLPWIPGNEVAGIVKEVGSSVQHISVDDKVVALVVETGGGYAQNCKAHYSLAHRIPDHVDFVEAASIPLPRVRQ